MSTINITQFTQVAADANQKLMIDENAMVVTVENISWKGRLIAFLQQIPLINKLIPPLKGDIVTQSIFLRALSAKYGENIALATRHDASIKAYLGRSLTQYAVKIIVDFAEHKSQEMQKLHITRLESLYTGVLNKGVITEGVQLWAENEVLNTILTPDECVAIRIYTGGDYKILNPALRSGDPNRIARRQAVIDNAKQALDKLAKNGFSYEKLLLRGMKIAKNNPLVSMADYDEGKVVTDKAFVSTTHAMTVAKAFSEVPHSTSVNKQSPTEDKLLLHLFIGKSGAQVEKLSRHSEEKEVLVKPDTQFTVLLKAHDKDTNTYKVVMADKSLPATHGSQGYTKALAEPILNLKDERQFKKSEDSPRLDWLDLA